MTRAMSLVEEMGSEGTFPERPPGRRPPIRILATLLLPAVLGVGCTDNGPAGPDLSEVEIFLVKGTDQLAGPGATLPVSLQVQALNTSSGRPQADLKIRWEIVQGSGGRVEPSVSVTDSSGLASTTLTLGPELGTYRVRARPRGSGVVPVEFRAEAVLLPTLTLVPGGSVGAGDTIRLEGENFSESSGVNVVTFSGIRGRVISSTASELRVEVPPCLPTRAVQLRVHVGALATASSLLQVEGKAAALPLGVGEDRVLDVADGLACLHLPSVTGSSYLVVPHSTGTVGGAVYEYSFVGLTADGVSPQATSPEALFGSPFLPPGEQRVPPAASEAQEAWDFHLRQREKELLLEKTPLLEAPSPPFPAGEAWTVTAPPPLGDIRQFRVLNRKGSFETITARLRYVGERSLAYVDEAAPEGGFSDGDVAALAGEFDEPIHPAVTGAYGSESDLDGNQRVIILFTAAVNRLTEDGSDGYVGGFFFGLDLLRGREGSNEGEIFYALVPDPTGKEGPVLSRNTVLGIIPAVLAHEFQHMVHFNQRILLGGATYQDALWLSEAMAQMAEDLVADAFQAKGNLEKARQYRLGNWARARRFLQAPSQTSVLASLSPGTLAERGAGWLLLKQVVGLDSQGGLLGELARSTRTGIDNLSWAYGRGWREILPDWAGSLFLDGTAVPVREGLTIPGLDLRVAVSQFGGSFPLNPGTFGGSSFAVSGTLMSSSPGYFLITPPGSGGVALGVGGTNGYPPDPGLGIQLLVVRLQ